MTPSQPAPKMLALEALLTFDLAISLICDIDRAAKEGREADALRALSSLTDALMVERPIVRGVIAAQRQAAEALHLAQNPAVRVLASIGVATEHAHSANDKPHSPAPHQPSDGVA